MLYLGNKLVSNTHASVCAYLNGRLGSVTAVAVGYHQADTHSNNSSDRADDFDLTLSFLRWATGGLVMEVSFVCKWGWIQISCL